MVPFGTDGSLAVTSRERAHFQTRLPCPVSRATILRQSLKFFLSVEGETDKWYFEHLRDLVNASPNARYKLTLRCDIEKPPLDMAKRLSVPKGAGIDV